MSSDLIRALAQKFHSLTPRERVIWLEGLNGHVRP